MYPLLLLAFLHAEADTLPGTTPLTTKGDIAAQLVEGVDRFLLKRIALAAKTRETRWKRDCSSAAAYDNSIKPYRDKLAHILGVRDKRSPAAAPGLLATTDTPALIGKGKNYDVFAVRWKAFSQVHGEGLLLVPRGQKPAANIVAIPDADVTPEQLCGLVPGVKPEAQYARRLAESGCRVIVPTLISREYKARNRRAKMTSREFIYRSAFELGRHLIGYELQKVFAAVDWFAQDKEVKIGVIGWGEGGMLALYAAAIDSRINAVCVAGYLGNERRWEQPIDRNVFGLMLEFGDAEVLAMAALQDRVIAAVPGPELVLPSEGGAPATLRSPHPDRARAEIRRAAESVKALKDARPVRYTSDWQNAIRAFLSCVGVKEAKDSAPEFLHKTFDPATRQKRLFDELDRHNQALLAESPYVRAAFMAKLYKSPKEYARNVEPYREYFAKEVVGQFDIKPLPFNPRTRKMEENEKWTIYQVVLDVYDDVIAYGLLIIPKGMKRNEKRPVVVCQHGLEGRPEHCINEKQGYAAYKAFATRLAERGFITFAPQNLYIGKDKFRTLQRKANLIKKTLFSVIVPQHQQITNWLSTQPNVDPNRIAFYGLSYGGKSAMRIPPLVKNYCLSICSADFNDWVWKNASSRSPYSYVWTMEYEIFEWDLGSTFNYSEMAALIAPRPFMVERGHFDGVAPDERVAYEYAKIRHNYAARLGLADRTEIEWFVGPHTINGKGTFAFLHKHLKWEKK